MSFIAFVNYEASALRFYHKTGTVSIISEQSSYMTEISLNVTLNNQIHLTSQRICYDSGRF